MRRNPRGRSDRVEDSNQRCMIDACNIWDIGGWRLYNTKNQPGSIITLHCMKRVWNHEMMEQIE